MRNLAEVREPLGLRRTEYYALSIDEALPDEDVIVGPFPSISTLEEALKEGDGEYTIVTKLKKVVVS